MSNLVSTQVQDLVSKALLLPSANCDLSKWSLDVVLEVAVEVAGLVKNVSNGTKQQKFDLLLQVVNVLLDQLQQKEVSSTPQDLSTVVQRWTQLKAVVNTTLPVVFSYTSHLSVPHVVSNCLSCFVADVVEVEQRVVAALPLVDEIAVVVGATGATDLAEKVVVEKVVADVSDVEKVEKVVDPVIEVVVSTQ